MSIIIHIVPGYEHLRPYAEKIASEGLPAGVEDVYRSRRNRIVKWRCNDIELNIKAFRVPVFPNDYVYGHLRGSKAKRSLENATRLLELGFGTPEPIAYIEQRRKGRLRESYYISRHISTDGDMRLWLDNPEAQAALPELAALMVRMHAAGVWHKDFSPGNIMFRKHDDGTHDFFLVDLNRMKFGVKSKKRQMRNFGTIYIESMEETAHLARLYADAAGIDREQTELAARKELGKYYRRKKRHRATKRFFGLGK